tara:strand:- start:82 stop:249 length:168 start_codon:yes stop_codon:yes gene_type:complete
MKNYEFTVEIKFNGVGRNKSECFDNAIEELDMYSVESLFYKGGYKIKNIKKVEGQ